MELFIQEHCDNIDWISVRDALKEVGMSYYEPDMHRRAFEGSYAVVFVFSGGNLIGFGRVLSDGAYQAGVYDIVVKPPFQGRGIGRRIMNHLLQKIAHCNIILYANPGKEGFYEKLGFRFLLTGMGKFLHPQVLAARGLIR